MFLKQEQLREEQTRHVRELNKQIKERERNLEQKQREDEELVKNKAQENLEIKQEQEKELEGTWVTQQSFEVIVKNESL